MALSKKAKFWIILGSLPFVLLILGLISLKLYFTSDKLKSLVIPKIEEATHRTVTVQEISFSILPSLAVSIDKLRISNPIGTKFDKEEFLSLDNMKLKVDILELFKKNLVVDYLIIDHPVIYMEVKSDGKNNYSMEEKPAIEKDTVQSKDKLGGAAGLLLSDFEIINGEVVYINKQSDSRLLVIGLNQRSKVENKTVEKIIQIEGECSVDKLSYGSTTTALLYEQPLKCVTRFTYGIENDVLQINEISIRLKELPVKMSGSLSNLQKEKMNLDLTISSPGVSMTQLLSLVPKELLKSAKGFSSTGEVKFIALLKGALDKTSMPGVQCKFSVSDGKIQYSGLPKSITDINITGLFEKPESQVGQKRGGKFSIDNFSAKLGENEIACKVDVTNLDDPALVANFSGSVNLGDVKEFYPLEKGTELNGRITAKFYMNGKLKVPQAIKANGTINLVNVSLKNSNSPQPLNSLNGTINFNNQLLESKQLTMNVGQSDMRLMFVIKNFLSLLLEEPGKTVKPSASVTLFSRQLRTADLLPKSNPENTAGEGKQINDNKGAMLMGLNVDASVSIDRLVMDKFEFTNAHGSVSLFNGVIDLKKLSFNAFQGGVNTKGSVDLSNIKKRLFNLDVDVTGVEANEILPKFTSFGNNLFGKFTMSSKLNGELDDTLGINTKTLQGSGKVQIFDGKLLGFPLTSKIADFTGVSELRELKFKNWSNSFTVSEGRVIISDLKVNTSKTDIVLNGSHGFDGSMAYNLTAQFPQSVSENLKLQGVTGQLLAFFKDKDGRVNLNFKVSGTTTSPTLSLDTKSQEDMAKQVLEQQKQKLLEQGKKKTEEEVKKKVEEGLKKLFKKP